MARGAGGHESGAHSFITSITCLSVTVVELHGVLETVVCFYAYFAACSIAAFSDCLRSAPSL